MTQKHAIRMISSTSDARWKTLPATAGTTRKTAPDLHITGERLHSWEGFGGCFNELGWHAMSVLKPAQREQIMLHLFDNRAGCGFTRCRMPIGASDYALTWYSLNEHENDFDMRKFSIDHDRVSLLPYIRLALKYQPDMKIFASPWSPPIWLKHPSAYNYGTLVQKPRYLRAYALYFARFVEAYRKEGIPIDQVHVQNEPVADQKFPSCLWTGAQMRDFIRDYLAPVFSKRGIDCEIWLGTLNTDDYDGFPNTVLSDPRTRKLVSGVGFQWAGKGAVQRTHQSWPDVRIMQTENECGEGKNTWEYAGYVFDLIRHYTANGSSAYVYWNMVLPHGGRSTWGWQQNSMISIDMEKRTIILNPEFHVMKHFAGFVKPGAAVMQTQGACSANALAFENPDGSLVAVVRNPFAEKRPIVVSAAGMPVSTVLPPLSVSTILIN